jgi:hypothetical protein
MPTNPTHIFLGLIRANCKQTTSNILYLGYVCKFFYFDQRDRFPYFKFTEYLTYKAALARIKVIKILEDWTSQTCRKCNQLGTRRTQGGHKDCLRVKIVVKRMLIEMLLLISLTGLWDIFPK